MIVAHMFHGDWTGPGVIWGILGTAATIAFWVLIALVIVKLLKSRPLSMGSRPSGIRILEERYARGEVSREEFVERRDVLRDRSAGSQSETRA